MSRGQRRTARALGEGARASRATGLGGDTALAGFLSAVLKERMLYEHF